ncbi:hypothetical protein D3C76_1538530 [compost metagenome]
MPLMAATVGTSRSSKALKMRLASRLPATSSASGSLKLSTNSVMSAPTMNTSLPLLTITPLIEASALMVSTA